MPFDVYAADEKITPFLGNLGDLFFRKVADDRRTNIGGNPLDAQTATDLAVEKHVGDFLRGISNLPMLSEEAAKENESRDFFSKAPAYWICDPIDGTTYFQNLDYGRFGTLLSFVEEGTIVAGWAYFPGAEAQNDILVKSITPDAVLINNVPITVASRHDKEIASYGGRFGISKNAYTVTDDERAQLNANKDALSIVGHHHVNEHGFLKIIRGEIDYFAHVGSHPWDYTVLAKFVTALGGSIFKFNDKRGPIAYEGDTILDAEMVVAVTLPGIDYNAAIGPLFKNTRWEKTCLLTPAM